jgi:hypothetical protein
MAAIGNQINAAVGNWSAGRTTWIADAHGYGKRFIVRADEKLTAMEPGSGDSRLRRTVSSIG